MPCPDCVDSGIEVVPFGSGVIPERRAASARGEAGEQHPSSVVREAFVHPRQHGPGRANQLQVVRGRWV